MGFIGENFKSNKNFLFGGGDNNTPVAPENLNAEESALVESQIARAGNPNAYSQDVLQGTDQSQGLKQGQEHQAIKQSALGGQVPYQEALNKRAMKNYGFDLNNIERQAKVQDPLKHFEATDLATKNAARVYQAEIGAVSRERQRIADETSARNAVMGSLFGAVGAVAGGMLGGPAGAAGGGAAGRSVAGPQYQSAPPVSSGGSGYNLGTNYSGISQYNAPGYSPY